MHYTGKEATRLSPWAKTWKTAKPDYTLDRWPAQTRYLVLAASAIGGWALILSLF